MTLTFRRLHQTFVCVSRKKFQNGRKKAHFEIHITYFCILLCRRPPIVCFGVSVVVWLSPLRTQLLETHFSSIVWIKPLVNNERRLLIHYVRFSSSFVWCSPFQNRKNFSSTQEVPFIQEDHKRFSIFLGLLCRKGKKLWKHSSPLVMHVAGFSLLNNRLEAWKWLKFALKLGWCIIVFCVLATLKYSLMLHSYIDYCI